MKLLFIHQGFPGQYLHIIRALAKQGDHEILGLGIEDSTHLLPGNVQYYRYKLSSQNVPNLHPWVQDIETKVIRADACARAANELKIRGFAPDIICGHPGWGELLFLKDIWPNCPILTYQEFFYNAYGFDYDFDPELQPTPDWKSTARIRMKTANQLLNLEASTWCITPTIFQKDSFPTSWHKKISVIHDGIDTQIAAPYEGSEDRIIKLGNNIEINATSNIITFVNRTLEPYRGCHSMIRAIPHIQRLIPDACIIIIGETTGVSYGSQCPSGEWKDRFLSEIEGKYNPDKLFFLGRVEYELYISILQATNAHIYLTYPFVLSWSLLEAMSCECPIIASNTKPVTEVIKNGVNGILVDFFSPKEIAKMASFLIKQKSKAKSLGKEARKTIQSRYELNKCVQRQIGLIELVATNSL